MIRAHKGALTSLKAFWQLLLHSEVSMVRLQRAFQKIEKARGNAERCYRAVMVGGRASRRREGMGESAWFRHREQGLAE